MDLGPKNQYNTCYLLDLIRTKDAFQLEQIQVFGYTIAIHCEKKRGKIGAWGMAALNTWRCYFVATI